jgi:hypothetical protein
MHPVSRLPDAGCTLLRLKVFHPAVDRVSALLQSVGFDGASSIVALSSGSKPSLVAQVMTREGLRTLGEA